jgi:hypothetical protein
MPLRKTLEQRRKLAGMPASRAANSAACGVLPG